MDGGQGWTAAVVSLDIIGARSGLPHLVRSMARSTMYVCMYVSMYVCMYVCMHVCMYVAVRSTVNFFTVAAAIQYCKQWYAYRYTGREWLLLMSVSFPCRGLQMTTMPSETKATVQPCPPSMIYIEKLGIRAINSW